MARAFRRRGARMVARLDRNEREVIASLMEQTRSLLAPDVPSTGDAFTDLMASLESGATAPEGLPRGTDPGDRDPALARLLPDAHRGDPAVAAEFRRLTEQDLRRRKSDALTTSIDALRADADRDRLSLEPATAQSFLIALTDTRLLMGERLGLRTEEDVDAWEARVEADPDDPLAYAAALYDFLTWLQDGLVGALMGRRAFPDA